MSDVRKSSLFRHINKSKTETLKFNCSTLRTVIINQTSNIPSKITIYDNIVADGTIVAIVALNKEIKSLTYNIHLNNGLTYVTEGDGFDVTLVYD